jgi:ElaA protein
MDIRIRSFEELSHKEVYEILQLRAEVFVVEQKCAYLDPDGKDQRALHVLGYDGESLVAYTRVFAPGDYMDDCSIGRVSVKATHRRQGLGFEIMKASMDAARTQFSAKRIALSAQEYLQKFYEEMGFMAVGDTYLEDDIPHIKMILDKN